MNISISHDQKSINTDIHGEEAKTFMLLMAYSSVFLFVKSTYPNYMIKIYIFDIICCVTYHHGHYADDFSSPFTSTSTIVSRVPYD